jgi:sugar phosphate isomerase/epimerase
MPAQTTTGSFPIGFRRGWSDWQKDLGNVIRFAKENNFAGFDVGALPPDELKQITAAGLKIGSVDAKDWPALASADAGKRKAAAQANADYMKQVVAAGCRNFFIVFIPEKHDAPRKENFGYLVDGLNQLAQAVKGSGARLAIEGWPGGAPHYSSLACTPADYRALFKEVNSEVMGVNFDPSHLIRMGCDPVRFLGEFADKVVHVHGKDTEILDDELYEHGNLQPATHAKGHGFGGHHWRYTLPGHGVARWTKMFGILKDAGYKGMVSIELEDENFNGTEQGEKRGFIVSRDYLASV